MTINCVNCGRPLCEIDTAVFRPLQQRAMARAAQSLLGFDATDIMKLLLDPTPEGLAQAYHVRCVDGCQR